MARKAKLKRIPNDPALINTSYTVFFVVVAVVWAKIFSHYFPPQVQLQAFGISLLFALVLYVFRFLVYQFQSAIPVLNFVVLYYGLAAVMDFASAVKGPIADGTVPAIEVNFFGAHVFTSNAPSYIVASVFIFYGAVTLLCSILSAGILETVYNFAARLLPKRLMSGLRAIDDQIDSMSAKESWKLFYDHEWKGAVAAATLMLIYAVVYFGILIA